MSKSRLFWIYWFPVVAYAVAIFVQSSFPSPDCLPSFAYSDKLLHFLGYGLLGALFYRAILKTFPFWSIFRIIFFSVLLTTLYGAGDEFHQSFVAARMSDMMDVVADFFGGSFGALFFSLVLLCLRWIDIRASNG